MSRPLMALLTDFGTADHYVGTMKGVALGICPELTLVDITHDIPPHDVRAGARQLAASYKYFPAGTVFLAVVDPGVGSGRRGLAVETADYRFVAPDNGLLSAVLDETPARRVVELTERKFARPTISRTFEGRDRFAPAAAYLARGIAIASLGRSIKDYQTIDLPRPVVSAQELSGEVLRVDRFGNLITNIDRRSFEQFAGGGSIAVFVGGQEIPRLVATYAEAPAGQLCALFGSTDHLEVAVNAGDAAATLKLARGAAAQVRLVS